MIRITMAIPQVAMVIFCFIDNKIEFVTFYTYFNKIISLFYGQKGNSIDSNISPISYVFMIR